MPYTLFKRRFGQSVKLVLLGAGLAGSVCAFADDDGVTPYRPSVSSPAQLPVPGQLELELGGLHSRTGDTQRNSLPYQLKLAFNKDWGILLGGEAYVSARDDAGNRARGIGDTTLVLKRAVEIDDSTALGLELNVKLPSARDDIGSGKTDYGINSIVSRDIGKLHLDANLNVTRLGLAEDNTSHTQTGLSLSLSRPLNSQWGITTEWSGTSRSGAPATAQLLAALTYSPTKRLTIDAGVAKGLNSASQDWSFFSGLVIPITKLW